MDEIEQREMAIGKFFSKEASKWGEKHDNKGIPSTAQKHVDAIAKYNIKSVVDVGAGPATVLLKMIDRGVEHGVAVDLSPEMCKEAEQRVIEKGLTDKVEVKQGSFLDMDLPETEAVSMHMVLCCHPDRERMLERSHAINPKLVVITVPRSFFLLRYLVNFVMGVKELFSKGFRPYLHKESDIIAQMEQAGYSLKERSTKIILVTMIFEKDSK